MGYSDPVSATAMGDRPLRVSAAPPIRTTNSRKRRSAVFVATSDETLVRALAYALDREKIVVASTRDASPLVREIANQAPSVALIDARCLGEDAARLCRRIRGDPKTARLPLIVLTAAENVAARIRALQSGADDSVSMPANIDELVARIRAIARRQEAAGAGGHLHAGTIEMDVEGWRVSVAGRPVALTKKEFLLLRTLIESRGRALSRAFLLERVWSHRASVDTRTVDVHVGRLRRKLGDAGRYIITVRNVGFRFDLVPDWISRYPLQEIDR